VGSWADLRRDPASTGIFCDFDGTLADIVVDPAEARPVGGAVDTLAALAGSYATVTVVSGRPIAFLRQHLDLHGAGVRAFGLYGLESLDGPVAEAAAWRSVIDAVATRAQQAAPDGVGIERKGLSVVLHARPAPEHDGWAKRFAEAEAAEHGLRLDLGRLSYELRPPLNVDKGTVVDAGVSGLTAACFIGDDRGDLVAFDALDRFAAGGGIAVRVAVRSDEAPPELLARADEFFDSPRQVVAALADLAAAVG
jgi:trehalose 6-phosphate phosphatase